MKRREEQEEGEAAVTERQRPCARALERERVITHGAARYKTKALLRHNFRNIEHKQCRRSRETTGAYNNVAATAAHGYAALEERILNSRDYVNISCS